MAASAHEDEPHIEKKLKHLEFIQGTINRMANTSFLLKGWSITVVAGLFALGVDKHEKKILAMALAFSVVFWFLDAYFLWQERLFRDLYDKIRKKDADKIDFSMNTMHLHTHKWYGTPFSVTLLPFYGATVVIIILFIANALRH